MPAYIVDATSEPSGESFLGPYCYGHPNSCGKYGTLGYTKVENRMYTVPTECKPTGTDIVLTSPPNKEGSVTSKTPSGRDDYC